MDLFVKPAAGTKVRSPDHANQHLPADGAWVKSSTYWTRRINDADVTDETDAQRKAEKAVARQPKEA